MIMASIVTLTTDFGTADGYVGEMKGVLASRAPEATLIDVTHDIPAHDVEAARLVVARIWRRWPPGTVHLVVVDPGVGSSRRAIVVESDGRFLVGPDNGVLSPALLVPGARVVELPVPDGAAPTFHGRDVFAPAAASLVRGAALDSLGDEVTDPTVRRTPEPVRLADGGVEGEVITVDRFGNAVTNLLWLRAADVEVAGRKLMLQRTYADVMPGDAVALVGSSGLIEIAVRDGSAAAVLDLQRGSRVTLRPR